MEAETKKLADNSNSSSVETMNKENSAVAYAYMVRCSDGSLYSGFTTDLEHRVAVHNSGKGAKYTRSRLPVELVYSEVFSSKEEAQSREWHLKCLSRQKKLDLVNNFKKTKS